MYLYADDMLLVYQSENVDNMIAGLQDKFNGILKWCDRNKLIINSKKTKFMVVSPIKLYNVGTLKMDDIPMSSVSQYEYLGMLLDNKLMMTHQVDNNYVQESQLKTLHSL